MKKTVNTIYQNGKVKKIERTKSTTIGIAGYNTIARLTKKPALEFFQEATLSKITQGAQCVETWRKGDITLVTIREVS